MKRYFVISILLFCLVLTACGEPSSAITTTDTDETQPESTDNTDSEVSPPIDSEESKPEEDKEDQEPAPEPVELKGTDLFESIYVPYATREKSSTFSSIKEFAENSNYTVKIVEPTEEIVGSVKFTAENEDYVFISFLPVNDVEIINSISYYQKSSNSEVVRENSSSDDQIKYDSFNTHIIGESSKKVSGIDDQRTFLFAE